jgi:hypothetical protein
MASTFRQCEATKRDGNRCQTRALPSSSFCFIHDDALQERRREGQRKGGQHRANAHRLRAIAPPSLGDVADLLRKALYEVHRGQLDPRVAGAMGSLARALVSVVTAGELEMRVRELEQAAKQAQEWRAS